MDTADMKLAELPTPCLVLDRAVLARNLRSMAGSLARLGVPMRPHMKTAKCVEVARMAIQGQPGGITVSTLAEAEYFSAHGLTDILYAVGIIPQKLDQVAKLNEIGARVMVVTDDADVASAIAAHALPPQTLIEIDCGEQRGGILPNDDALLEIASRLGPLLSGVMTHAGHSYSGRGVREIAAIAEAERAAVTLAASRLREAGHSISIVSAGSSPTARHAENLTGVTEMRPGVFMFGDLFQAEIETHGLDGIAVSVLTSVIGRRPGRLLVDAGGLALSKDRSTESTPRDYGFGLAVDLAGRRSYGNAIVRRAYQEHGVIEMDPTRPIDLPIGGRLRILPNHTCMTCAAHDRYFVVDGDGEEDEVVAAWTRLNGW
jgi:D-serine deaminase-like pyridoxal phosphate-dependent protein